MKLIFYTFSNGSQKQIKNNFRTSLTQFSKFHVYFSQISIIILIFSIPFRKQHFSSTFYKKISVKNKNMSGNRIQTNNFGIEHSTEPFAIRSDLSDYKV